MMAADNTSGFTVTCPSNSNMDTHPTNVGSNYTVRLPQALNFSGQTLNETVHWQVAMLSVHYTNNFFNFREPCTLRIIAEMPPQQSHEPSQAADASCAILGIVLDPPTDANTSGVLSADAVSQRGGGLELNTMDKALLRTHIALNAVVADNTVLLNVSDILFARVVIPAKHYSGVSAIVEEIVSQVNKAFGPRYKLQLTVTLGKDGKVAFSLSNGKAVGMFADTLYIASVLGVNTKKVPVLLSSAPEVLSSTYKLDTNGSHTPKLNRVQALYIYGDIVEFQYVGDTMAPLLAYVDVEKSPGERVGHVCNPPVYLPVSKSFPGTITIRICDEHGRDVSFPDDVANVIVRLHFRKCKQASMF